MFDISSGSFISPSFFRREERIQAARKDSQRCLRELRRDRSDLERRERQMMSQLKAFVKKGDYPKANLVAKQVALFRNLSDKNFERSLAIQTEVQVTLSNQRINRAHAESIKALNFANLGETLDSVRERERKYQLRIAEHEAIESILNEGFDEIYDNGEISKGKADSFERQIEAVFLEALDPSASINRDHLKSTGDKTVFNGRVYVEVKNYSDLADASVPPAIVFIPTFDLSVDMLKQLILRDKRASHALGLDHRRSGMFHVGDLVRFAIDEDGQGDDGVDDGGLSRNATVRFDTIEGDGGHHAEGDDHGQSDDSGVNDKRDNNAGRMQEFSYKFVPFDIRESLNALGIKNGSSVWIVNSS